MKTVNMKDLLKIEAAGGLLTNPRPDAVGSVFDNVTPADDETREFLTELQAYIEATVKFHKLVAEKAHQHGMPFFQ